MDLREGQNTHERDWFDEFHDEQSLLLDPPVMLTPPKQRLTIAPKPAQPGLRTSSVSATVLKWLTGRTA